MPVKFGQPAESFVRKQLISVIFQLAEIGKLLVNYTNNYGKQS